MVYLADEECHASADATTGVIASLDTNGVATLALYDAVDCLDETPSTKTLSLAGQGVSSCSEGNLRLRLVKDTPEPPSETPSSTTESPTTGSTSTTPTPSPAPVTKTPEPSVPASTLKAPAPTPSSTAATEMPKATAETPSANTPSPATNSPATPATKAPASSTSTATSSAFAIEPMLIQAIAASILIDLLL